MSNCSNLQTTHVTNFPLLATITLFTRCSSNTRHFQSLTAQPGCHIEIFPNLLLQSQQLDLYHCDQSSSREVQVLHQCFYWSPNNHSNHWRLNCSHKESLMQNPLKQLIQLLLSVQKCFVNAMFQQIIILNNSVIGTRK